MSDRKSSRWHPTFGHGQLYYNGETDDRFVTDSGTTIPLPWKGSRTGRPGKKLGEPGTEEWNWITFTLDTGEVYSFRTEAPR